MPAMCQALCQELRVWECIVISSSGTLETQKILGGQGNHHYPAPDRSWACPHFTVDEVEAASLALLRGPALSPLPLGSGERYRLSGKAGILGLGGGPLSPPLPRPLAAAWPGREGRGGVGVAWGREGDAGSAGRLARGPARPATSKRRGPPAGDVTSRPDRTRASPPGGPRE